MKKSKLEIVKLISESVRAYDLKKPTCLATDWCKDGVRMVLATHSRRNTVNALDLRTLTVAMAIGSLLLPVLKQQMNRKVDILQLKGSA